MRMHAYIGYIYIYVYIVYISTYCILINANAMYNAGLTFVWFLRALRRGLRESYGVPEHH